MGLNPINLSNIADEANEKRRLDLKDRYNSEAFVNAVINVCINAANMGEYSLEADVIEDGGEEYLMADAYKYMKYQTRRKLRREYGIRLEETEEGFVWVW